MKTRIRNNDWHSILYANPVVLVSTRSPEGVDNVSPYGMCMPVSFQPPLFVIGVSPDRQTYGYIKRNREFAINLLTPALKRACVVTAEAIPPSESEFDLANLTRVQAEEIDVALVGESPANMECRLHWMRRAGDHYVVVGEVMALWIEEDYVKNDMTQMRLSYDNLYHIGEKFFQRGGEV